MASPHGSRAGPRWPKGQGRVHPGETSGVTTRVSPSHPAELPAPTGAVDAQTRGAGRAHQSRGRSATLMQSVTQDRGGRSGSFLCCHCSA